MLLEWWTDQIKSPKTVRVKPTQDTMKGRCIFSGGSHMTIRSVYRKNIKISLPQWQKKNKNKKGGFGLVKEKKEKKTYKQHNKSQIPQNPSTPSFPEPRDVSNLPSGETWFQSWSKRLVLPTRLQFHPRRDRA